MDQKIIELYDEYTHAPLDRRVFIRRLTTLAGSAAAASALLPLLENNYAQAQIVPADDDRLETSRVTWPGASGELKGYLAKPKGADKLPAVIVIHENRGLNPHIEDIVRRMALEGFLVLGPDMLSPLGGTPADEDQARTMIGQLNGRQTVDNLTQTIAYLRGHADSTGKVGAVGFCWGGGMVNALATASPDLAAGVVYYGRTPPLESVPNIRAKLLLNHAGLDTGINENLPAYEAALKKANVDYRLHVYPDVNHAFNNDTNAARYDATAARLAWDRTTAFLKQNLSS
ncbi:carboxymethylenebutenolidase [Skermanella stibiiresistens SB22]|uniref:Carboxymethylenebutenolidase n=1 Tax=Skermanella stibiiresistens SB22 TaxID=1385369 RepID=W9HBP5_9PROT|nr:dienelactone hydrolase family protein [Skermanella stibiiresistens]EWY42136.1 carboxymethylenebutenolidase [Skermanella stibiiresistens SB22]